MWLPLYDGCGNGLWRLELYSDELLPREYALTAVSEDEVELLYTQYTDEADIVSVLHCRFQRTDPGQVEDLPEPETIVVGTTAELMEALGNRTTILLAPGEYNITEWLERHSEELKGWFWVDRPEYAQGPYLYDASDGPELVLAGYRDLTLRSRDPESPASIVCSPRYANVLTFQYCTRLRLENLILGHTPEQGNCSGAVVNLESCVSPLLADCELYGCGTYGVTAWYCPDIAVEGCEIHDCTYGCATVYYSRCDFTDCDFHDCRGFTMFDLYYGSTAFTGCSFRNLEGKLLYVAEDSAASFKGCVLDEAARASAEATEGFGDSVTADWGSAPKS